MEDFIELLSTTKIWIPLISENAVSGSRILSLQLHKTYLLSSISYHSTIHIEKLAKDKICTAVSDSTQWPLILVVWFHSILQYQP
jgi:hypothetical protein